jgi:glycosyltransferase involved in cell wall biosynthesis
VSGSSAPRVSFVVPTYNYARFVGQAVDSLLDQTYHEIEVIVIDDASTDGTQAVLAAYAADPRVRLVRHEANAGHIRTYNEGIAAARGEFVGLLSADDLCLDRDAVRRQVALFDSDPAIGFVYPAQAYVDESGRLVRVAAPWPDDHVLDGLDEFRHLVFTNYVPASGPLVRRTCHDEIGCYDERLPHAGDWDLWLRLCTRYRVGYLAQPLYGYRMHGVNMHHHAVTARQATGEHVDTVDRAFRMLPRTAPRTVHRLRGPALRQAALSAVDWEKGQGRAGRAWKLAVHSVRRSPSLLRTRRFYVVLAKLALVTGLGSRRSAWLSALARGGRAV